MRSIAVPCHVVPVHARPKTKVTTHACNLPASTHLQLLFRGGVRHVLFEVHGHRATHGQRECARDQLQEPNVRLADARLVNLIIVL